MIDPELRMIRLELQHAAQAVERAMLIARRAAETPTSQTDFEATVAARLNTKPRDKQLAADLSHLLEAARELLADLMMEKA
jgi:hypothetical protein